MKVTKGYIDQRNALLGQRIVNALEKRGYEGYYVNSSEEAKAKVLELIPEGSSVSWGGSMTLDDMGIKQSLHDGNYKVLDRELAKSPEERQEIMKKALTCDVFLSSVNAISQDGQMVNIDGNGNRIAAIAYGPKTVILTVGMNKVEPNLEAARARARNYAAPINALKLGIDLPCTKAGICMDCMHPQCACAEIVEMRMNRIPGRIKVILIGEEMGL
ncbi:MAG: lactate utilization protein [Firmicutes bacterium]|nr:lactate utilization protein [Bacillota bacterium]